MYRFYYARLLAVIYSRREVQLCSQVTQERWLTAALPNYTDEMSYSYPSKLCRRGELQLCSQIRGGMCMIGVALATSYPELVSHWVVNQKMEHPFNSQLEANQSPSRQSESLLHWPSGICTILAFYSPMRNQSNVVVDDRCSVRWSAGLFCVWRKGHIGVYTWLFWWPLSAIQVNLATLSFGLDTLVHYLWRSGSYLHMAVYPLTLFFIKGRQWVILIASSPQWQGIDRMNGRFKEWVGRVSNPQPESLLSTNLTIGPLSIPSVTFLHVTDSIDECFLSHTC